MAQTDDIFPQTFRDSRRSAGLSALSLVPSSEPMHTRRLSGTLGWKLSFPVNAGLQSLGLVASERLRNPESAYDVDGVCVFTSAIALTVLVLNRSQLRCPHPGCPPAAPSVALLARSRRSTSTVSTLELNPVGIVLRPENIVLIDARVGLTNSAIFPFVFVTTHAVRDWHVFLGPGDFNGDGYFYARMYWTKIRSSGTYC